MKYSKFILFVAIAFLVSCKQNTKTQIETPKQVEITLTKLWETDTLLNTCEAVRYDSEKNIIYVSNIGGVPPSKKDSDGSMSIINLEGKIIDQNWVTGIDAPKGVSYFKNKLYVTDIDNVAKIDLETGVVEKKYTVENSVFLNDLDIDTNGDVYFTDSSDDKIYKLVNDNLSLWLDLKGVNPNGILVEKDRILVVLFSAGDFIAIDKKTQKRTVIANGIVGGDGIVPVKDGYLVSSWKGEVYFVGSNTSSTKAVKILDTKDQNLNAADIGIIPNKNILLVPTFFGNKVVAYKINTSYK